MLNKPIKASAEFTNLKDKQTVSGEFKVEVEIESGPVLPTEVTFVAQPESGDTLSRTTTNVGESMMLLWRTDPLKKGSYQVWLEMKAGAFPVTKTNAITVKLK